MDPEIEIVSEITDIEIVAVGSSIREIGRLRRMYGQGRWRKLKGVAMVAYQMNRFAGLRYIGTKPTGSARRTSS